jgi:hypothetical protein
MAMNLTAKRIERLRKRPGRYHDGHGLILQVRSPTNASWLLRYQRNGKEHQLGLGPLRLVPLKTARERARAAQLGLLDGIDPVQAKREARAAAALAAAKTYTFEAAAHEYYRTHERGWKNAKHRAQFISSLTAYAFPVIGKLSLASIDTGLVLKVIEPIWDEKTETANRVRGRIEKILDWATVRGYRSGDNPARWKGHIAEVLPARGRIKKTEHHPALPFDEMPEFMAALAEHEGLAARALEFTILTAARTSEAIGATWDEVNLKEKV